MIRFQMLIIGACLAAAAVSAPARPIATEDAASLFSLRRDADATCAAVRARVSPLTRCAEPGALPTASRSLAETDLALAALQVEKVRDYLLSPSPDTVTVVRCLGMARDLLSEAPTSSPPRGFPLGRLLERAYFADNDGSPQPYWLCLPPAYTPERRYPLVLFLHGWVPDTSRINPWVLPDDILAVAQRRDLILACPHGRRNTDFQFVGEVDVLRVKREVEAFYSVDPDSVYLAGASMGGVGAWQIAMHYPDEFAGVAPISAQSDWFRFWREMFRWPPRDALPRHVERIIAMYNPLDLAVNLSSLHSYSQHAPGCFVGVQHSRDMATRLRELGAPHQFEEAQSDAGHFIYLETQTWERVFDHLLPQRRQAAPEVVRYATHSMRFPGAYWVRVSRFLRWGRPAFVEARHTGPGALRLTTVNAAGISLAPPAAWAGEDGVFRVEWNGNALGPMRTNAAGHIELRSPDSGDAPPAGLLRKSSAVCGPASDVFNFPFVGVVGTAGSPSQNDAARTAARQFAENWDAYAEGRAPLMTDAELTEEVIRSKGLVLFGTPQSNRILRRIAPQLPLQFDDRSVSLPDGTRFSAPDLGLVLIYPNPLAPDRYVLVCCGLPWGDGRPSNHKFDLLPDFAVFTRETVPAIGINRFLAAGFFDENWQFAPALTDR